MRCFFPILAVMAAAASGQEPASLANAPHAAPGETSFPATWETQKLARTHLLGIPAPRGQITDRHGSPLAQSRVSYNLGIVFPTPLTFSETRAVAYAKEQVALARRLTGRDIQVRDEAVAAHYKNRGVVPLVVSQDLLPDEMEAVTNSGGAGLALQPVYVRFYPNGALAGHIIGYAGRTGRVSDGPIRNNETLWPDSEGREGLEQTFNTQLAGQVGQMNLTFDAKGRRKSQRISIPPQPGHNVITTLDENIQRLCEDALKKIGRRGAIVILDPNSGDVLAMASWPSINPNSFVPVISTVNFKALQDDPDIPLLPRAYRSAYPPGSTFKPFIAAAAIESGAITPESKFPGPPSYQVGKFVFRNWKKEHAGMLNAAEALTQSCNTWFYQVGIKAGSAALVGWAEKVGFGVKTGIPLRAESEGRMPTDDYMRKVHGRKLLDGDLANLSIGQGDILVSPLQMAQAMGAIANGGILYQTRLVQQVQAADERIITGYEVRAREHLDLTPATLAALKEGLVGVVSDRLGTAAQARVPGIKVAGKTGTAQWGPKNKERTAAWFAGFAPAGQPRFAFAALYEGNAGEHVRGGMHAAPLIGSVLRELFKQEKEAAETPLEAQQEPDESN